VITAVVVAALMALSFATGFFTGRGELLPFGLPSQISATAGGRLPAAAGGATRAPAQEAQAPEDLGKEFDPFWEAWNFAERSYYRQPVDRVQLVRGAIKGLLASLNDQQAAYLDPVANRMEKANLDGVVEGIGATVELRERRHTIIAPVEDGPAARAGLRSGDVILKVDGKEVGALSLAEVVAMIRGPSGTKVKVTVVRPEDPEGQPMELELTRARLELESVSSRVVADGIGYVRIRVFGTQTVPQLTRALRDLRSRRVRGLILDLRDNPGGYLSTAVDVSSQFLKDGSIVFYEERDGQRLPSLARPGGLATDLTIAVLVNRGSASASEVVAGAIRDHNRGVLIGESTFGKGSVQLIRDLSDGSSVRVTSGTWLTPAGRLIEARGLTPSIEAKPTPDDERAKRDVVLEKALEWFRVTPPNPEAAPAPEATPGATPEPASTSN
jgi:carboxyl-terminal processing protease